MLISENRPLTINYKVLQQHNEGVVGLLINNQERFIAEYVNEICFKSMNISQIYKQERGCLLYFARPSAKL